MTHKRSTWSTARAASNAQLGDEFGPGKKRERHQPGSVESEEQGIMSCARLPSASPEQRARISPRVNKLDRTFDNEECDQKLGPAQRHDRGSRSTTWKAAVKPGPRDDIRTRPESPFAMRRSSTNSTVGADMLP